MADKQRDSVAIRNKVEQDKKKIARLEAENGLRQASAVFDGITHALGTIRDGKKYRLRPSTLLELNRLAVDGITEFSGVYRPHGMEIYGSKHNPPPAKDVPELVEDMCDYITDNWENCTAVHLAAYLMWRINWIHPFDEGNGRTSRAVSYMVLCIHVGGLLPGKNSIADQIVGNRVPYYDALEAADKSLKKGKLKLDDLEQLLSSLLAKQLADLHIQATSKS